MSKTVTPFSGQLVTFSTSLPFAEVTARLEAATHKSASSTAWFPAMRAAKSKEDVAKSLHEIIGDDDFIYFLQLPHNWINYYKPGTGSVVVYVIGNPVIAQTMMVEDIRASFNIPPRVLVVEKEDKTGTEIHYHLPSAVYAISDKPALKAAAESLDGKLEALIRKVISETSTSSESASM
ncbi:hypothetical protein EV361DRAFT_643481 [Lentinula raphanica]|uniref:DUF302 domain-containing protein n=1 Tax=Lentinula raphanica TaxID=153919 RepID=A0AA38P5N2_9AGAR|nr:hypothetical protein C8R42DRAFT_665090 [Lentinula raphanica]KAJ3764135.1 hypothetical protein EV360DRAFT_65721 [Lentinula raphanica]KAJ3830594.1 hypothetical protein F5880DRAFT_593870 [Lentinula raphanica]KAJ3836779.1 hypothetical protein F5878DRAFT_246942 [Lentinula raphanica]KAJ3965574.1 hypothetical protein EV361DRAFT_643481 [Lentinula raphanica]